MIVQMPHIISKEGQAIFRQFAPFYFIRFSILNQPSVKIGCRNGQILSQLADINVPYMSVNFNRNCTPQNNNKYQQICRQIKNIQVFGSFFAVFLRAFYSPFLLLITWFFLGQIFWYFMQIQKREFALKNTPANTSKNDPENDQKSFIQAVFTCHSTSSKKTLNYLINAKTFKCQLGEFYTSNGCQQCEPNYGFYSVEYNVVKCSIFDVNKLENITSNQLKLREGFWRPNYHSNFIELCFKSLKQCIGGWEVGDSLCYSGHIGALCEECDSFNIRGDGNYFKISNTECVNCSNNTTLLPFFLMLLWSLISIMVTLRSTSNLNLFFLILISQYIFSSQLFISYIINFIRKTNKTFVILKTTTQLYSILFQLTQDFQSILLKMLLNYVWLFSVIFAFNVDFNFSLMAVDSISSPNVQMTANLDCQLISLDNFKLIYMRLIVMMILILIQILIILSGFKVFFLIEKNNFDKSIISNLLIYLFVSNQAQLIKSFCSLVAVRTISGMDYIQGDVSLLFYEKDHTILILFYYITWIYVIILPSLIITGLLVPLFFLFILIFNKNKFTQTIFRKHLGYLFNEYNEEFSYWESIKILQRSVIIIIITYFETNLSIKASLMSLTLLAYIIFAVTHRPYIIKNLNNLDFQSCSIILVSIFLAIYYITVNIVFITITFNQQIIQKILLFYKLIAKYYYNCFIFGYMNVIGLQSNNTFISTILYLIMLLQCIRICYIFVFRIISYYYKKYQLLIFSHLKKFAFILFRNTIIYIYFNQQYEKILMKKQTLDRNYEKLREWQNLKLIFHKLINQIQISCNSNFRKNQQIIQVLLIQIITQRIKLKQGCPWCPNCY